MASEGHDIVILLTNSKLYFYSGDGIISLDFPPEVVHDMDIKNKEALSNLVSVFIQNNKLSPAQIYFVLSETVCFSRDFAISDPANTEKVDADAQNFLDSIPFNTVISKIYKTASAQRVVGANQDLIDTILDAFAVKGFGLTALVPANIYHDFGAENQLTPTFAKAVLSEKELTTKGSMINAEPKTDGHEISTTIAKGKTQLRLYILIGVFVLGLLILGVLLLNR